MTLTGTLAHGRTLDARTELGRVLLAEDNSVDRLAAGGILAKLGLKVDTVSSGLEAVGALRSEHYTMVVMDIEMPEMSGLEATRLIRASAPWERRVPIVALTEPGPGSDRMSCLEGGMDDWLSKPATPQALSGVCARWIEDHETRFALPAAGATFLERLLGDHELASRVVAAFLFDVPLEIERLRCCVQLDHAAGALRHVRSIKGAARTVDGHELYEVAAETELAARDGDTRALRVLERLIEREFAALARLLRDTACAWAPESP